MKNLSIYLFSIMTTLTFALGFTYAEEPTATEKVARELLEVSGATKMVPAVTEQLIMQQRKTMPDIPEAFWKEFITEINQETLNEKMATVYAKYFNIEEMKEIIKFYKTDAGKKFINKLPEIAQESRGVFRQWTMDLRMQITKKLESTDLKKMRENAQNP